MAVAVAVARPEPVQAEGEAAQVRAAPVSEGEAAVVLARPLQVRVLVGLGLGLGLVAQVQLARAPLVALQAPVLPAQARAVSQLLESGFVSLPCLAWEFGVSSRRRRTRPTLDAAPQPRPNRHSDAKNPCFDSPQNH